MDWSEVRSSRSRGVRKRLVVTFRELTCSRFAYRTSQTHCSLDVPLTGTDYACKQRIVTVGWGLGWYSEEEKTGCLSVWTLFVLKKVRVTLACKMYSSPSTTTGEASRDERENLSVLASWSASWIRMLKNRVKRSPIARLAERTNTMRVLFDSKNRLGGLYWKFRDQTIDQRREEEEGYYKQTNKQTKFERDKSWFL